MASPHLRDEGLRLDSHGLRESPDIVTSMDHNLRPEQCMSPEQKKPLEGNMKEDYNLWRVKRSADVPISLRENVITRQDVKTSQNQSRSSQTAETSAITTKFNTMTNWNQPGRDVSILSSEGVNSSFRAQHTTKTPYDHVQGHKNQ